jgi:hypothetical protein
MFTCAHPQACPTQQIFFPTTLHRRVIWSSSSQLSAQRRLIYHFIFVSERCTQLMGIHAFTCAQPQGRLTQQIFFLTALHRRIIWSSSQLSVRRRPALRSNSISDRNHTPIAGALSQVCVLEDVSCSCNHQNSLSTREAFSTRPSLSRKYSNFVLASGLVKISMICSWVGRYCTCIVFLCTMSLI